MNQDADFVLTGFGDEISPELTEQLSVLTTEGIRHLELRGIWNRNVLELDEAEVDRARTILADHGVAISAIASPIGKVPIDGDFDRELARFQRALDRARDFGARYLRIFAFYPPEEGREEGHSDEVVRRLSVLAQRAEEAGVLLLHENDKELYGQRPEGCLELMQRVNSPALRLAFDPANFVQVGVRPFDEGYWMLADYVEYVHIKDAVLRDGTIRLPGQGDGQIMELLRALKARGYRGFLSMEPHLSMDGRAAGFSGPRLFTDAIHALKVLLAQL